MIDKNTAKQKLREMFNPFSIGYGVNNGDFCFKIDELLKYEDNKEEAKKIYWEVLDELVNEQVLEQRGLSIIKGINF